MYESEIKMNEVDSEVEREEDNEVERQEDNDEQDEVTFNILNEKVILDGTYFKLHAVKGKEVFASCLTCKGGKRLKGTPSSLSNFTGHLKRCHPDEYKEFQNYKGKKLQKTSQAETSQSKRPALGRSSCKFNQQAFEKNITNFILKSTSPLDTVENPHFRKIFDDMEIKKGESSLTHLSRRKLTDKIIEAHEEEQKSIKNAIDKAKYICTTGDVWKNKARQFLGSTAHWIDDLTLERKSAAIACARFPGSHTFDKVAEKLHDINSKFNLDPHDSKLRGTLSDNGSNFVKAFKVFGIDAENIEKFENEADTDENQQNQNESQARNQKTLNSDELPDEDQIEINNADDEEAQDLTLPKHYRCMSHTISLACSSDYNKYLTKSSTSLLKRAHQNAIKKCNILWNLSRSPNKKEKLFDVISCNLPRPVEVRWNSLYDSFNAILRIAPKMESIAEVLDLNECDTLNRNDFDYIESYIECMRPLAEALDILQADDAAYGFLVPTLISMKVKLNKSLKGLENINNQVKKLKEEILRSLMNSFEKRFDPLLKVNDENSEKFLASFSHPFFKNEWLQHYSEFEREEILNYFTEVLKNYVSVDNEISSEIREKPKRLKYFEYSVSTSSTSVNESSFSLRLLVDEWFQERRQELKILNSYPAIKKMYLRYNTVLCSSAPVERLFSYATILDLPKYNKLSDYHFEIRVLARCNSKKLYK